MGAKLKTIKICGFRGFNSETEIPLEEVVLVYGLNGSGKSSFAEAIEWLFFDDISRRRLSPCPGEYSAGVYLGNLYSTTSTKSFVEVVVEKDGKNFTIRKELENEKTKKLYINGQEVKDLSSVFPDFKNHYRPILAQVEISALVNTEQKDRWEQLAKILGQEDLTALRERLIELRAAKKDVAYKRDEEIYKGLCRANEDFGFAADFIKGFEELDFDKITQTTQELLNSEGVSGQVIQDGLKLVISRLSGTEVGKRLTSLESIQDSEIDTAANGLKETFENLNVLAEKSSKGKLTPDQTSFYISGLNIAKIPDCPFCYQKTLTDKRLSEIKSELESDKESINAKRNMETEAQSAIAVFHKDCGFSELVPSIESLKLITEKLGDMNFGEFCAQTRQFTETSQKLIKDSTQQLKLLYDGYVEALNKHYFKKEKVDISGAQNALMQAVQDISIKLHSTNEEWRKLRDAILPSLPKDDANQGEQIRKWIQIEKSFLFVKNKQSFARKYNLIEVVTQSIQKKLEAFEKAEVAKLLTSHSEEIKKYYEELNPGETVNFDRIEVSGGQRRQAKLVATSANSQEINPVTIFSEAHINSLSLSIYFPQRVDRNPVWDILVLDDPVQSMDKNHSKSLLEILARKAIENNKQIIVLTHEQSFAESFFYRFHGVKPITYYEFNDKSQESPIIEMKSGATKSYLEFVRKNANGNSVVRESASNTLRKSIEAVIGEILIKKGRTLEQVKRLMGNFGGLFDQFERVTGVDKNDVGKLRSLLSDGHDGSHAFTLNDTTPGGLLRGAQSVEEVYAKYLQIAKPVSTAVVHQNS